MPKIRLIVFFPLILIGMALALYSPMQPPAFAQQPTGSIPTVTGTPQGVIVALYGDHLQEYVYAGPSSYLYPIPIGLLLAGQEVPAYGYSEDKTWIQIYYPGVRGSIGWVYAPYMKIIKNGDLPIIAAPPTSTPSIPTINPTLAAAYITPIPPTRLPTFTESAPLVVATFVDGVSAAGRIPMGLLILGFGFIGMLGVLISFLRGR